MRKSRPGSRDGSEKPLRGHNRHGLNASTTTWNVTKMPEHLQRTEPLCPSTLAPSCSEVPYDFYRSPWRALLLSPTKLLVRGAILACVMMTFLLTEDVDHHNQIDHGGRRQLQRVKHLVVSEHPWEGVRPTSGVHRPTGREEDAAQDQQGKPA